MLTAAAEQWVAEGRKPGALWTGAALDVALADADKLRAAAPLDAQEEDFLIEFLDRRGVLRRYVFRTFSEFFHVIRDAAVPVDGRGAGHE